MRVRNRLISSLVFNVLTICFIGGGRCETMSGALTAAYQTNPDLNQQRAATRATDEDVAKAESGYRPTVTGHGSLSFTSTDAQNGKAIDTKTGEAFPNAARLTARETIFDGNRTTSNVERSESQVLQSREKLRDDEQQTLQSGATAYMDVLRDIAVLDLRKSNVEVLIFRLREARARFRVEEVTNTDVAEVASSLATARSGYFTAQGNLYKSMAAYRRIVGVEPHRLEAARPLDDFLPPTVPAAIATALQEHPRIQAALQNVDVAASDVHVAESRLYPTLTAVGRVGQSNEENGNPNRNRFDGSVSNDLDIPFYTGGADYAAVREAKEKLARARFQAEAARDDVRAQVESTWGMFVASKASIQSAEAAVKASEAAFVGVREEAKIGQRTTLNLLEALQTLLQARVSLVTAQHDRVVASYAVVAAIGRLNATTLGLNVQPYDPTIHFEQVKDKWIGLRTPDGQ